MYLKNHQAQFVKTINTKSKRHQDSKEVNNRFRQQFNRLLKNDTIITPKELFERSKRLIIDWIDHLVERQSSKISLEEILQKIMSLGAYHKNTKLIFFTIKLVELYTKNKRNKAKLLAQAKKQMSGDFPELTQRNFCDNCQISISDLNSMDEKLRYLVERAIVFLFRFISIQQNENHKTYINYYLKQSWRLKSFNIFYQMIRLSQIISPLSKLKNFTLFRSRLIHYQYNPLTFVIKKILKIFVQRKRINSILDKLSQKSRYWLYLKKDFSEAFQKITSYLEIQQTAQSEDLLLFFINILIDAVENGLFITELLADFSPMLTNSYKKINFFFKVYLDLLSTLTIGNLSSIDMLKINQILIIIVQNKSVLILPQHNFIRIVDKIVSKIQTVKRQLLQGIWSIGTYETYSKQLLASLENLQKITEIQSEILENKTYLQLDNFSRTTYLITSSLVEIQNSKISRNKQEFLKKIQKWVVKLNKIYIYINSTSKNNIISNEMDRFLSRIIVIASNDLLDHINKEKLELFFKTVKILFEKFLHFKNLTPSCQNLLINILKKTLYIFQKMVLHEQYNNQNLPIYSFSKYSFDLACFAFQAIQCKIKGINNQNEDNLQPIKQIIAKSAILFCLSEYQSRNEQNIGIINLIKSVIWYKNQSINFKNDILEQLQGYTAKYIVNQKMSNKDLNINFLKSFFHNYKKIILWNRSKQENIVILQENLKIMNFIMYLKFFVGVSKQSSKLADQIEDLEYQIFQDSSCKYIEGIFNNYSDLIQKNLQLGLDLLLKRFYLTTHSDSPSKVQDSLFSSLEFQDKFASTKKLDKELEQRKKTKKQKRQEVEGYMQKCIDYLYLSFTMLNKIKNLSKNELWKILNYFKSEHSETFVKEINMSIYSFPKDQINNFSNILRLLSNSWNLIWIYKICDLDQQLQEIVKLRLGIVYSLSDCRFESLSPLFMFEYDKLKYFDIIKETHDNPYINNGYHKSNNREQKLWHHKLLLNESINQEDFRQQKNRSRAELALYVLNNEYFAKNIKYLVNYFLGFVSGASNSLKNSVISSFDPPINIVPETNYYHSKISQKSSQYSDEKNYFNINELAYPLLTKTLKKSLQLTKQHHQPSRMRNLLCIIASYFSKIGLGIYYEDIVEMSIIKGTKLNIIRVLDCFKMLCNNPRDPNSHEKIFEKIDKIFIDKRKSRLRFSEEKEVIDLVNKIKKSQISMNFTISKIILCHFKDRLHNYQIFGILDDVYKERFFSVQSSNPQYYCRDEINYLRQEIQKVRYFEGKITKQKSLKNFNTFLESIEKLSENLPLYLLENYQYALVAQSMIGFYLEQIQQYSDCIQKRIPGQKFKQAFSKIDKILLKMAILMIDFNYQFKEALMNVQDIKTLNKDSARDAFLKIKDGKKCCELFINNFKKNLDNKITFLCGSDSKHSKLQHALSIIYPLRNSIYNIAILDTLTITKSDRRQFEDLLKIFGTLIEKDSEIVTKQKSHMQWWTARKSIDKQIGKMAKGADLGIFDIKVDSQMKLKTIRNKCFEKIANSDNEAIQNHFQYILLKQGLDSSAQEQQVKYIKNQIQRHRQLRNVDPPQQKEPNILILTINKYTIFPFEKLQSLSSKHVYRIPSINYVYKKSFSSPIRQPQFNIKNLSYVINTYNDLKTTQKMFYDIKQKYEKNILLMGKNDKDSSWQGITGKLPSIQHFSHYFTQKDIYLYMGHGIGIGHLKQDDMNMIKIKAILLLFGCSSVSTLYQNSEMFGLPLNLLINNCPAMLGCLWDVTDKDTDLLTSTIFTNLLQKGQTDLSQCVQNAKKVMKLPNLNGGAVVVYGLPCKISKIR